mmetsp:Transcript_13944/g.39670  ORF Transcript_13944/g.39670 Transcript_13944/m.39670 type:complete len:800 (+) Transcript_13944:513-2912(+)
MGEDKSNGSNPQGFFRVPFIVVPDRSPASLEVDTSLDDDEPISSNSSNQSSDVSSPQESLMSSSETPSMRRQSPCFEDSGLSDLQTGYLGENENSITHRFLSVDHHHQQQQQQHQHWDGRDRDTRVLFSEMKTPTPRRSVRRREGSMGSVKSRSSQSSRRSSSGRFHSSRHFDDSSNNIGSSTSNSPLDNSFRRGGSENVPYTPHAKPFGEYLVPTPPTDNSSESSRGESGSERRRYSRRYRHMMKSPSPPSSPSASSFDSVFKRRLSSVQLMLWTLFVAAVTSSVMLISTNGSITRDALYPDAMDFAAAPPLIQPQRNSLMHSESGLRGKLVQGRAARHHNKKHSAEDRKMVIDEDPEDHAPKKTDHKKHDKHFEKSHEKQHSRSKRPENKKKASHVAKETNAAPTPLPIAMPPSIPATKNAKFDAQDIGMYSMKSDSRRIIILNDHDDLPQPRKIKQYPAEFTDNTQLYPVLDSDDERLQKMEIRKPYSEGECVPMQDWQTTYHPSCNGMHELQLNAGKDFQLFGTKGFWRHAWKLDLNPEDTVVLKTLRYVHNFEDAHFEHDRVDAVAMERLTSSPHVIDIFGFCGHSVMTEFADGSRVGQLADKAKRKPLERLRIARDIASGLADVHGIDGDGNATFVHLDINPANVVSIGGTLKLNDFNIGIIRRWNTTSNEPCGFPAQYPNPQWRSPEEARNEQNLTEKVDIFSMGHIFFRLICGHEPWNKLEPGGRPPKEVVNEKVQKGVLPFIPEEIRTTTDPEVKAIRDVMLQCYSFDPKQRPSARQIAKKLNGVLNKLK